MANSYLNALTAFFSVAPCVQSIFVIYHIVRSEKFEFFRFKSGVERETTKIREGKS